MTDEAGGGLERNLNVELKKKKYKRREGFDCIKKKMGARLRLPKIAAAVWK